MLAGLTCNDFLGGRVRLWQPERGYRSGIDPVFLAASVEARAGQRVLELGCGAGAALFCLAARVAGLELHGVEVQPFYADLARRNAEENGVAAQIYTSDLAELPGQVRALQFDHVMANPPYFPADSATGAANAGRRVGRVEEGTALSVWVRVAAARVRPGGSVSFILRAERLAELLSCFDVVLGRLEVLPLAPRVGRAARLVIVRGRAQARAPLTLHAPLVLHDGAHHERDGDGYGARAEAVLRGGAGLLFGGNG